MGLAAIRTSRTGRESAPNVRITTCFQLDFERRTLQFESLPEKSFQVTPITVGNVLERAAVDDDARRVRPALVRVAQLRSPVACARRLLLRDRGLQRAREPGRRQLRHAGR